MQSAPVLISALAEAPVAALTPLPAEAVPAKPSGVALGGGPAETPLSSAEIRALALAESRALEDLKKYEFDTYRKKFVSSEKEKFLGSYIRFHLKTWEALKKAFSSLDKAELSKKLWEEAVAFFQAKIEKDSTGMSDYFLGMLLADKAEEESYKAKISEVGLDSTFLRDVVAVIKGYSAAQYDLAVKLEKERGVPESQYLPLFVKAADKGHVEAMTYLIAFYEQRSDFENVFKYHSLLITRTDQIDSSMEYDLACMYEKGQGCEKNLEKARYFYLHAAKDDSEVLIKIAKRYENQEGKADEIFTKDYKKACDYFCEAILIFPSDGLSKEDKKTLLKLKIPEENLFGFWKRIEKNAEYAHINYIKYRVCLMLACSDPIIKEELKNFVRDNFAEFCTYYCGASREQQPLYLETNMLSCLDEEMQAKVKNEAIARRMPQPSRKRSLAASSSSSSGSSAAPSGIYSQRKSQRLQLKRESKEEARPGSAARK